MDATTQTTASRRAVRTLPVGVASLALALGAVLTAMPAEAAAPGPRPGPVGLTLTGAPLRLGPVADRQATPATVTGLRASAATTSVIAARAVAVTYDDRLLRRSVGWRSVAFPRAYKRTLTCTVRTGAALVVRVAARNGGTLYVQAGPRRGTVEVRVKNRRVLYVSTAAARVASRAFSFRGAGAVVVRVVAPGRGGLCIDAVRLNPAPTTPPPVTHPPVTPPPATPPPTTPTTPPPPVLLPGALRPLDLAPDGSAPNGEIINASLSPGGTMIAFWSTATNLVPGVTSGTHLFLASVATGRILGVVDSSAAGAVSNDPTVSLSNRVIGWRPIAEGNADSLSLLFESPATNLGPTPAGGAPWLWSKNLQTGEITGLASGVTNTAAWSPDGSKVLFATTTMYGTDNNGYNADLWSLDLNAPSSANLWCVSCTAQGDLPSSNGGASPTDSGTGSWAPDSTRVVFESRAAGLVAPDTNSEQDVFVKNIATGDIQKVSTDAAATPGDGKSMQPQWSPNGQFLAFVSNSTNLYPGHRGGFDVYVKEPTTLGAIARVSTTSTGESVAQDSFWPQWSPDGTRIAYESGSPSMLPAPYTDSNNRHDVFVKDLNTGLNQLVSITSSGVQGVADSTLSEVSWSAGKAWLPDGSGIVFTSPSDNFAPNANAFADDLFLKVL